MNGIYLIKRIGNTDYDQYSGFVVVATNSIKARELAKASGFDEALWLDPLQATCRKIGTSGNCARGVVLESFHAG